MFLKRTDFEAIINRLATIEEAIRSLSQIAPKVREEPKIEEPKVEEPKTEEPKTEEPKVVQTKLKAQKDLSIFVWYDLETIVRRAGQVYSPKVTEYIYDHDGMRINITPLETGAIRFTVTGKVRVNVRSRNVYWVFYCNPTTKTFAKPYKAIQSLDQFDRLLYKQTETYIKSLCRKEK